MPWRVRVGREEIKAEDLREINMYLVLFRLIVSRREESQDEMTLRSDWTAFNEDVEIK